MHRLFRTRITFNQLALAATLAALTACSESTGPGNGGNDGGDGGDGGGSGTLVTSGTPLTGRSGGEGSTTLYRVVVPDGATGLLVTTAGGTGDLDLYIRAGSEPTETAFDCESTGADNDESCSVTDPESGTWYILLVGYEAYSGATMTVTVTGGTIGGGGGGGGGSGTVVAWSSVTMGASHACGLSTAGKAYCWGARVAGETGDGDPVEGTGIRFNNKVPYAVAGGLTFAELSAGSGHTCGITTAGALYCWGSNAAGQIGDGGSRGGPEGPHWRNVPVAIAPGMTFISVAAGSGYTCAVAADGVTYCWGANDSQAASGGHAGAPSNILTPRDAQVGVALTEVYAGGNRATCGRTSAGAVYCWGSDSWGMLGDGPTQAPSGAGPKQVAGSYQQVSIGSVSGCAVGTDQGMYCWGENHDGQVGYAASGDYHNDFTPAPVAIGAGLAWKQAAVGSGFACGLTTSGAAYCWGLNSNGQAGIGSYTPRHPTPTAVTGGHVFASLSPNSKGSSMCGVTTANETWCWGYNIAYQLGTTTPSIDALAPVKVAPAN